MTGRAAADARDAFARLARTAHGAASVSGDVTYRLVASEEASKRIADGSLRWATASKGDASVLIKDTATGRVAEHGTLAQVRPSPAKVLGPAVWEAMAMATQQHYLVEINAKLDTMSKDVKETLGRWDDDKKGELNQAFKLARSAAGALADGKTLSSARVEELRRAIGRVDVVWHQLHQGVERRLDEYRTGTGATSAEVEQAWSMLLHATQAVGELSAVLTAVPYATVQDLQDAAAEERERVQAALDELRRLSGELHAAHVSWSAEHVEWSLSRTRNPVTIAQRKLRKRTVARPACTPLDDIVAWRMSQLAAPPTPPAALLVTLRDDGDVRVGVQPDRTSRSWGRS